MLTTKHPGEFLAPFTKDIAQLRTAAITNEPLSFSAPALADEVKKLGLINVGDTANVEDAIRDLAGGEANTPPRILICGSLYLAGIVLGLSES